MLAQKQTTNGYPEPRKTGCTRVYFENDFLYGYWQPWVSHATDENSAFRTLVFRQTQTCADALQDMDKLHTVEYDSGIGMYRVSQ